ncbi:MAG: hypothetical protein J1F03_05185 [Oscillospiraceae bacterium]|nr:hypothetical protein [Oscillospiraceae bacterium]
MSINDILLKFKIHKASADDRKSESIRKEYNELLNRLSDIRSNYNFIDNPSSIDALIYEENAALCRLQELYREAREYSITLEAFERNKK